MIYGRSNINKNTIHIHFNSEHGEIKQLAEFLYSKDYVAREFSLESVTGIQRVTFVFLPGSNFDFKWFKFIQKVLEGS